MMESPFKTGPRIFWITLPVVVAGRFGVNTFLPKVRPGSGITPVEVPSDTNFRLVRIGFSPFLTCGALSRLGRRLAV